MTLDPVERSVQCADGYRLRYRTWAPEGAPRAALVLLNGVMSHSGWFQPLAGPLLGAGLKVVGADRRGTGLNQEARGDAPSARALVDDVKRVAEAERVDGAPLYLAGWCWGAVLAINVAAEHRPLFSGLALLAPGLYPTEALKARMAAQQPLRRSNAPGTPCLESPIREEMFTGGPLLESFIRKDEQRLRHFTPRFCDAMDRLALGARTRLERLALPILLVLADADQATDNAQTANAFTRLTGASVRVERVEGAHGMQFDAPGALGRILVSWSGGHAG
jgi:alpha-beta hydrolase superfamily lysophospholipase